jgi:hypothetical protein
VRDPWPAIGYATRNIKMSCWEVYEGCEDDRSVMLYHRDAGLPSGETRLWLHAKCPLKTLGEGLGLGSLHQSQSQGLGTALDV